MTDSIFTKIIKGEIPCHKIEENEHFIAFLDIMPLKKGHTLVVPKVQVDYIFDLEDQTLGDLMIFAKKVAKKIEAAIPCERIGVAVIGLDAGDRSCGDDSEVVGGEEARGWGKGNGRVCDGIE